MAEEGREREEEWEKEGGPDNCSCLCPTVGTTRWFIGRRNSWRGESRRILGVCSMQKGTCQSLEETRRLRVSRGGGSDDGRSSGGGGRRSYRRRSWEGSSCQNK